ncbi:MAG: pyruvate kinase [Gemmataceae bacterium]
MSRRTRIVATLGPATDRPGVLEGLLAAGLDVARINFSHGDADEHLGRVARLREAARLANRPVAILADLPGPKLRALLGQPITLTAGQEIGLAADETGNAEIGITEPELIRMVQPGQRILLDDGRLQLEAVALDGARLRARVMTPGTLLPNKGVNLPDTEFDIPALTARDEEALAIVARADVDWIALSFVRSADAAGQLRAACRRHGIDVPIMAKIERPEAIRRAAEIIQAFDGIMVARGDLGVEMDLAQVPPLQKELIESARAAGRPVITATDMLDSMRKQPRPTRAEASDVANAIFDGTDAVMLSGETAVGQYPVEALSCMDRIARTAEAHWKHKELSVPQAKVEDHVTSTTCALARELGARAIVSPTLTGRTVRLVARHRPQAAIIAPSTEAMMRRLCLVWGLTPILLGEHLEEGGDRLDASVRAAFAQGLIKPGDRAILLAGHPVEGGTRVPTIRVVRVGDRGQSTTP